MQIWLTHMCHSPPHELYVAIAASRSAASLTAHAPHGGSHPSLHPDAKTMWKIR